MVDSRAPVSRVIVNRLLTLLDVAIRKAAHAGRAGEGIGAVQVAARAIAAMKLGRIDERQLRIWASFLAAGRQT